jgi:F0F1-type ATP synthase assembly protein I
MAIVNQKKQVFALVKMQAIAIAILFLVLFAFFGIYDAGSNLIGASVSLAANFFSVRRLFSYKSYESSKILSHFYSAEILKIAITLISFVLILKYARINQLFFIIGYAAASLSFWVAPLLTNKNRLPRVNKMTIKPEAEQLL